MTNDQAIEACVKAMLRRGGYQEDNWQNYPQQKDLAENLIACLEVLGLFRESDGFQTQVTDQPKRR